MFRTKSGYIHIDENSTYTEIRNKLHRAYRDKGAKAGVRFVDGLGLYIKNEKANWRKFFDSQKEIDQRQEKFTGAKDKLKAAIDREYRGWTVNGESMGKFVFSNLAKNDKGEWLNEEALKDIDELIAEGVTYAEGIPKSDWQDQRAKESNLTQIVSHRNLIFEQLKAARKKDASRSWAQRWWARRFGDNQAEVELDRASERACNWRSIVHGNRVLSEAVERDLEGAKGDFGAKGRKDGAYDNVRSNLTEFGGAPAGLTRQTYNKVLLSMRNGGVPYDNVEKLETYIDLIERAQTNIDQLRRLNADIKHLLDTKSFGAANASIREALRASKEALAEGAENLSLGVLSGADSTRRAEFYEGLKYSFDAMLKEREPFGKSDDLQDDSTPVRRLRHLIEDHLTVTHDLALALLKMNVETSPKVSVEARAAAAEKHAHNFRLHGVYDERAVLAFNDAVLSAGLPRPTRIFQSASRKLGNNDSPEQNYNWDCYRVVNALNAYKGVFSKRNVRAADKVKSLEQLRKRLVRASKHNDRLIIAFGRHGALGGKAHARLNDQLHAQRRALQRLKLIGVQEQLRLKELLKREQSAGARNLPNSNLASNTGDSRNPRSENPPSALPRADHHDDRNNDLTDGTLASGLASG